MEPVSVAKRMLARVLSQPDVSGTHEGAPDGFLLAYGASVRAGRVRLGRLVDVTPTILYFLGLPVARDMDGDARTDVFTRTFTKLTPYYLHSESRVLKRPADRLPQGDGRVISARRSRAQRPASGSRHPTRCA